jgi:hypothetical protein
MVKLTARRQAWVLGALIALGTIVAYLPVLRAGFVWDDDDHVTRNETLVDLPGLRRIWLERGAVPQYYPLVHTSFWIERHLWGLDPAGYHATNILLHALAAILLWRVLVRLRVPGSFLAAMIFALHPVGVESVAWITERKNVLAAVFYFASALAWLRLNRLAEDHRDARGETGAKATARTSLPHVGACPVLVPPLLRALHMRDAHKTVAARCRRHAALSPGGSVAGSNGATYAR